MFCLFVNKITQKWLEKSLPNLVGRQNVYQGRISLNFERSRINKQSQHLITPVIEMCQRLCDCFHQYFSYKSNQIQQLQLTCVYVGPSSFFSCDMVDLTSVTSLSGTEVARHNKCISPPHLINSTSQTIQLASPIRDICYTHPWRC